LNCSEEGEFEELLFWGKICGTHRDYYIAMGITYSEKYEFPEKKFFYALSSDFKFVAFPTLNDQHNAKVDIYGSMFTGIPDKILIKVEDDLTEEEKAAKVEAANKPAEPKDPLESTEEEDPMKNFVKINFKECDRLLYTVQAIENDCHIIPQGSMRLTEMHEVARNPAFKGLSEGEVTDLACYSHFRNVQTKKKQ